MARWFICLSERGRGHTEGSFSERGEMREAFSVVFVRVCDVYLIEQRQTAGNPVLQFDNGDEVTLLSVILARVAKRQRVILQKQRERERLSSHMKKGN